MDDANRDHYGARMFQRLSLSFALGMGLFVVACGGDDEAAAPTSSFAITSPAFQNGQPLPDQYTCVGKNFPYSGMPPVDHLSPELNWTAGPTNTQSYAIVFRDMTLTTGATIDERGYHWAIYDIPASVRSLSQGLPSGNPIASVPGAQQYSGGLFNNGYVGPCPSWSVAPGSPLLGMDPAPTVKTDSYTFTVYAMRTATITAPAMRPAPAEGAPPISYVKDLDEYFAANAIAKAQLGTTSNAQPAMFATPPAP
jgi:phosphatidylethanolamine-binding protein (PEBP) family uncharacterized protein